MHGDVKQYVKTCNMCQQIKVHRHTSYRELQPLPAVSKPRELMSLDFITGLPLSKYEGKVYNAILVVVDACIKYNLYIPCIKNIKTSQLADKILHEVFSLFGAPQNLVSN